MAFLGPAFWVVILLGVMILIHELGHFWAALAVGIKVETFSIGFGPRLFGFHRGDTDFRISAIPFGGYVRMLGDQPTDDMAADPRSFLSKARWQRAIVIVAGPLMNIILAVGLVTGLYMAKYPKELDTVITGVVPNSPAAQAGLREGDRIIQFGDSQKPTWDMIVTQELVSSGRPLHLVVLRGGNKIPVTVTPQMDPKEGVGQMGIIAEPNTEVGDLKPGGPAQQAGLSKGDLFLSANGVKVFSASTVRQTVIHSGGRPVRFEVIHQGKPMDVTVTPRATSDAAMPYQIGVYFQVPVQWSKLSFTDAFAHSIEMNERNATTMFQVLAGVLERRVSPKSFSGPIGIAQMSSEAASQGAWMYLSLMAFVSLQLAIFNLLPIPILDGGTLVLLLIEMLMQREVSLRVKETVFKLGFVFLMMLVVFVIYNDITKVLTRS